MGNYCADPVQTGPRSTRKEPQELNVNRDDKCLDNGWSDTDQARRSTAPMGHPIR